MRALARIRNEPDHAPSIGGTAIAVEQLILRAVGQFVGGSELITAARAVADLDAAVSKSATALKAQSTAATNTATSQAKLAESAVAVRRATIDANTAFGLMTDASTRLGISTELLTTQQQRLTVASAELQRVLASGTATQKEIRTATVAANAASRDVNASVRASSAAYRDAAASATAYATAQERLAKASVTNAALTNVAATTSGAGGGGVNGTALAAGAARFGGVAVAATGIAAGAAIVESTKLASELDATLRGVLASTNGNIDQLETYRQGVIALARDLKSTFTPNQIGAATYPVLSSYGSLSPQDVLKVTKSSLIGAGGTGSDPKDFTTAITAVLKAYGEGADHAAEVTDQLVTQLRLGRAEIQDILPSLGTFAGLAASLKIPFSEVSALNAQLSYSENSAQLGGQDTAALLRAMYISRPTAGVGGTANIRKDLGLDFSQQHLSQVGFYGALQELQQATAGPNQARLLLGALGTEEAARAAQYSIGANSFASYQGVRASYTDNSGVAQNAFAIANSGPAKDLQKSLAALNTDATDLGKKFLPLETALALVTDQFTKDLFPAASGLVDAMNRAGNWLDNLAASKNPNGVLSPVPQNKPGTGSGNRLEDRLNDAAAVANLFANPFSPDFGNYDKAVKDAAANRARGITINPRADAAGGFVDSLAGRGGLGNTKPGRVYTGGGANAADDAIAEAALARAAHDRDYFASSASRGFAGGGGGEYTPSAVNVVTEQAAQEARSQAARIQADHDARQAKATADSTTPGRGGLGTPKAFTDIDAAQAALALDEARGATIDQLKKDGAKLKAAILAQNNTIVPRATQALQALGVDREIAGIATQRQQDAANKSKDAAAQAAATRATADNLALQAAQIYEQSVQLHKGSTQALLAAAKATHDAAVRGILDTTKAGSLAQNTALSGEQVRYEQDTGGINAQAAADAQAKTQKALQGRINSANADLESATLAQQAAGLNHLSSAKQLAAAKAVQIEADRVADLTTAPGSKERANAHLADALQYQSTAAGITSADVAKAQATRASAANLELTAAQLVQSGAALHHASSAVMNQAAERTYQAALLQIKASGATGQDAANQREAARQAKEQTIADNAARDAQRQLQDLQNKLAIDQARGKGQGAQDKDQAAIIAYERAHAQALGLDKSDIALQAAQYAQSAPHPPGLTLSSVYPTGVDNNTLNASRGEALFRFGNFPTRTEAQTVTLLQAQLDQARQIIHYLESALHQDAAGNQYLATIAGLLARTGGRTAPGNGAHRPGGVR